MAEDFLSIAMSNGLKWVQGGWGGYVNVNPLPGGSNAVIFIHSNKTKAEATSEMAPFMNFIATLPNTSVAVNEVQTVNSFYDVFTQFILGLPLSASSRLLQDVNFNTSNALAETQRAMRSAMATAYPVDPTRPVYGAPVQLEFATPFNTPATGGTSETPAWRTAVVHAIFTAETYWNSTSEEIAASHTQVSAAAQYLRDISPQSGAYLSESALHEPNWQESFWGRDNYARLSALKKRFDPHTLLTSWHAIDFNPEDPRFACYV
ncbi:hypothetical protein RQP46_001712 [Phenoliferia psychrophenolica]